MPNTLLQLNIPLNGTGTEIPALNITDNYNVYYIFGTATAIGNYAIVPTGTPFAGLLFHFKYKATLDITTNGTTFSLFGTTITQTQLLKNWEAECYYDGTSWEVVLSMDFSEPGIISSANLGTVITGTNLANSSIDGCTKLQNLSVCTAKIADDAITTVKILDANVTDAKITDVNGSKVINNTITNAKLATMSNNTVKANVSGATATPSDVSIPTLLNSTAWTTTGNSGLIAGTNFIGTTDAVDLVFKANNVEAGRINLSLQNTSFGTNTLVSITTGNLNTSIGRRALNFNTTGYRNTALGDSSLYVNNVGLMNTAIGYSSMSQNTNGSVNTSVGSFNLQFLLSGSANTSIGYDSGSTLTTGNNNTLIGYEANVNSASSESRIALGKGALATTNYQFALPDDVLNLKLRGTNYVFPPTDGLANQVLSTNGSGVLSWSDKPKTELITIPISFETGEESNNTIIIPFDGVMKEMYFCVTKAIGGTDDAFINARYNMSPFVIMGSMSIPMSSAVDTIIQLSFTPNTWYFNENDLIRFQGGKTTDGGKGILSIVVERT